MRNDPPAAERAARIREMFARIAPRYDLMNRLMTAGQDVAWRRQAVRGLALPARARVLDLGCGTGDLAREVLRQHPDAQVIAADFTAAMILRGRLRPPPQPLWCLADALALPYATASFDAVVCAFLLRNVADLRQALREMARILKPGGQIAILETTRPAPHPLHPVRHLLMRVFIPWLGGVVTGQRDAYTYLPQSSMAFLSAADMSAELQAVGFTQVRFVYKMVGTIAIHWGHL